MKTETPYYHYIFFDVDPAVRGFSAARLKKYKKEFSDVLNAHAEMSFYAYRVLGFKPNAVFMLWFRVSDIEEFQKLLADVLHTRLGRYLRITYTLFGIARPSLYTGKRVSTPRDEQRSRFLIIYPFTKTKEWYLLPFEKREDLMTEHIRVGHGFTDIRQHLLYAFGVDDHEFIVSYETNSLQVFQDLVIALRSTEVRRYTKNDQPIFTCLYNTLDRALDVI